MFSNVAAKKELKLVDGKAEIDQSIDTTVD